MRDESGPRGWLRTIFPTCRRLLIGRGLRRVATRHCRSVLVVGAGGDPYRGLFAAARRYVCLDLRPVPRVTDVVGDGLHLPFGDGQFDCVVATECMEHVVDPFVFAAELTRVTAHGGTLLMTVPFLFHQHGDPHDFWRPTAEALRRLLRPCQRVDVLFLGHRLHVISDLVTTAFAPHCMLLPLRAVNHLLARLPGSLAAGKCPTTAPTGYLVCATK